MTEIDMLRETEAELIESIDEMATEACDCPTCRVAIADARTMLDRVRSKIAAA